MKVLASFMVCLSMLILLSSNGIAKKALANPKVDILAQLFNTWYVKSFSFLAVSGLSEEEARSYLEQNVVFKPNLAIVFNDTCTEPKYIVDRVSANMYLRQFKTEKESIGIKSDTVVSIDLSCVGSPKYFTENSPEFNYAMIIDQQKLSIIYNGVVFHLEERPEIKSNTSVEGDTVKCIFNKNKSCSGYVIQGTRKKGRVKHVIPQVNKEFPLEAQ